MLLFYAGFSPSLFCSENAKIDHAADIETITDKTTPDGSKKMWFLHKNPIHTESYNRALFYINRQTYNTAAAILREDLKRTEDLYDNYESYALILGMCIDRKIQLPEKELEGFLRRFNKMQAYAPKDIKKIERSSERINHKISRSKSDPGKRDKNQHDARHYNFLKYLSEKRLKIESYKQDPFQFERMAGDYFYRQHDIKRAYVLYSAYYTNLDRPVSSFIPQSMKNYIDILWKSRRTEAALLYQGFLVNLKPYMFTDLFHLARMYYLLDDRQNSLFLLLFIDTLADGYSKPYCKKAREQIFMLLEEMKYYPKEKNAREVAGVYLTGENIQAIRSGIAVLRDRGIENFYFYYLEGVSLYLDKDYEKALDAFQAFNDVYPWLADSCYYAMLCMDQVAPKSLNRGIIDYAQKTAELKPHSPITEWTRLYMGKRMGLDGMESAKLLFPAEITKTIDDFTQNGAPVQSLTRLCTLLSISGNPYQLLAVQQMSGIMTRRGEYIAYLKDMYSRGNNRCKKNIARIIRALGEEFE